MLMNTALVRMVQQGDGFTSIDLKDECQHVEIYPPHKKSLRFGFCGEIYEYKVFPFGLSLSPRVVVKCTLAGFAPLRRQGVRLACYIDKFLLSADSEDQA